MDGWVDGKYVRKPEPEHSSSYFTVRRMCRVSAGDTGPFSSLEVVDCMRLYAYRYAGHGSPHHLRNNMTVDHEEKEK